MEIIEYSEKYKEDVKELLVELEEYIISIDEDDLDQLHEDYREKMIEVDLKRIKKENGKCFLAIENNHAIGLIMGVIPNYDEYDYLDYKCPKKGEIIELIVTKKVRNNGLGKLLINKMEDYFKENNCKIIKIEVFSYNKNAISFYNNAGYHSRMITDIKIID